MPDYLSDHVHLSDDGTAVVILDQTCLPNRTIYRTLRTAKEMFDAIHTLQVRGAPAIGICAAYDLYVLAQQISARSAEDFLRQLQGQADDLCASRPTAVNLSWALARMMQTAAAHDTVPEMLSALHRECLAIHREDIAMCRAIGKHGQKLINRGDTILTHCNAGALATADYGTALGVIRAAFDAGKNIKVYADETRPLLQGARLTAYELAKDGIPVTLITDNMAGWMMRQGKIKCVVVGADRITRNGDVANKIGTYSLSVLAKEHRIPFYVAAPTSTIDFGMLSGDDIVIEQRDPDEIKFIKGQQIAPDGIAFENPAFDVTPHQNVTAIITEKGVISPPYYRHIPRLKINDR